MRTIRYDNDETLMQAFREGGQDAFTTVYRKFYSRLYHYARRFVGNDEAYDAVAEAFVRLWHQRDNFEATQAVERWLFVTVRNRCLSVLKKIAREHDASAELLHQLEISELPDLQKEELYTELVAAMQEEIDRLPPRQKEIFLLSFKEGLKPAEIAERLSLNIQTVKNQKLTAIRLLQTLLGHRAVFLTLLVLMEEERSLSHCL